MTDPLQVTTEELHELSSKQQQAASLVGAASAAAQGVSSSMLVNHGVICAGTTAAVMMAEQTRSAASAGMQAVSTDLAEKLNMAATNYQCTDQHEAGKLYGQMHTR